MKKVEELLKSLDGGSNCKDSIVEIFMEVAKEYGESTCLVYNDNTWTYRELNDKSNQLARYLEECGVRKGTNVGLYQDRTPELIMSILAIWKVGAVYVPIVPTLPSDRVRSIIEECQLQYIISSTKVACDSFLLNEQVCNNVILVDQIEEQWNQQSAADVHIEIIKSDLAYIMFTSGSTGRPKGVMVEHKGIPNMVLNHIARYQLTEEDRVLFYGSIAFAGSLSEIFTTLIAGATLVLLPDARLYLGEDLYHILYEQKITLIAVTPSVLNTLPDQPLPDMKTILSGGEPCSKQLVNYWANKARLFNGYGATELTVCAAMHEFTGNEEVMPVGQAHKNITLYVLDNEMKEVGIGEVGELYVDSVGVARGYLNQPEMTKNAFIPNPFDRKNNDVLFKTGDMCKRISEQELQYIGREDNQVKIAGIRIDLDEIIQTLTDYDGIVDATVIVVEDDYNNKQLYAYFVANQEKTVVMKDVKAYLRTKLPTYMVPSRFMMMDEFPVTVNGKLDKKRLPAIEDVRPDLDVMFVAPRTDMEKELEIIWREILRLDQIGVYDNFFDLGGQSIMATQVVSRIRGLIGMEIPLFVLFEGEPTIERMATAIENYQIEQMQPEELESLLSEIEGLSDEELAQLL